MAWGMLGSSTLVKACFIISSYIMFTVFRMKHFLILDYLINRWLNLFFSSGSRCLPSKTNDFASHSNSPPISTHPYHSITSQLVCSPKEHEPKWPPPLIHISIMICHTLTPHEPYFILHNKFSSSPHWPTHHFPFLNKMFFSPQHQPYP